MHRLLSLGLVAIVASASGCHRQEVTDATAAADAWLALIDAERYDTSWAEAASFFRSAVADELWQKQVGAVRRPLGKVTARKVKSAHYMTSLPGAPDGKYVVIQYDTSFEHKASATETVTPMVDTDGKWRVSGYFVR